MPTLGAETGTPASKAQLLEVEEERREIQGRPGTAGCGGSRPAVESPSSPCDREDLPSANLSFPGCKMGRATSALSAWFALRVVVMHGGVHGS